jgi:hypothetical protein
VLVVFGVPWLASRRELARWKARQEKADRDFDAWWEKLKAEMVEIHKGINLPYSLMSSLVSDGTVEGTKLRSSE